MIAAKSLIISIWGLFFTGFYLLVTAKLPTDTTLTTFDHQVVVVLWALGVFWVLQFTSKHWNGSLQSIYRSIQAEIHPEKAHNRKSMD